MNYTASVFSGVVMKHSIKKPQNLFIIFTRQCNSRCVMCGIWKKKSNNELALNEYEIFFKKRFLQNINFVTISGGEPLVRKELPQLVELIISQLPNIKTIYLATNGIDKFAFRKVKNISKIIPEYVDFFVQISYDGDDLVRGIPDLNNKLKRKILKISKLSKVNLVLNCTIQQYNVNKLENIKLYAAQHSIKINFNLVQKSDTYFNNKKLKLIPIVRKKAAIFLKGLAPTFLSEYHDSSMVALGHKRQRGCIILDNFMVLESNGNLYTCINDERESYGNIKKQNLKNLWYGPKHQMLRKRTRAEICPNCNLKCTYNRYDNLAYNIKRVMGLIK